MNTRHIVALISCILLASSSLVACGDSDDDQDNQSPNATPNQGENAAPGNSNSGPNDDPNNSNNANNSNNTTPNNGGDWQQFPLDGIYQVTSHTEQIDGCDGNGSPVTGDTADYVRIEGHSFEDLEYRI